MFLGKDVLKCNLRPVFHGNLSHWLRRIVLFQFRSKSIIQSAQSAY